MQIAVLLFDGLAALEAVAPLELLARLPGAQPVIVGERLGPVRSAGGVLGLTVDAVLAEVPRPDVLLVPGGPGHRRHLGNGIVHQWLRAAALDAGWTVGIGAGAVILACAGVLSGHRVAEIPGHTDLLTRHGAVPVARRVVFEDRRATAVDGAAALELASALARRLDPTFAATS